jgi:polyisoprenoid-binding protein YceI
MKSLKGITFVFVLAAAFLILHSQESRAEAVVYDIDPDHSQVIFKVKHLGISNITGRFDLFSGSYSFDEENPANSSIETEIVASSINTNKKKRDDHLKSDEFLDVEKFPSITFKSKEVKGSGDNLQIVGDLTIHGVTKEVTLDTDYEGSVTDPWGNKRSAFTASTEVNRKDFGMTWNKALEAGGFLVGDTIKIIIEVEGIQKKS